MYSAIIDSTAGAGRAFNDAAEWVSEKIVGAVDSFESKGVLARVYFILTITLFSNAILLATPGFYSHDELGWMQQIATGNHGWDFFLGNVYTSPFFRLLGAMIISASLRLPLQPLSSHFVLVLLHAINCVLYYSLVRQFRRDRALAAALLFAILPSSAYCAGWIAAGYDVQYVLFSLVALNAAVSFWRGRHWASGLVAALALVCALMCKEPAVTLIASAAVLAYWDRALARTMRLEIVFLAFAAITVGYFALRFHALAKVGTVSKGGYVFGNLGLTIENATAYLGFPFAIDMSEISDYLGIAIWRIVKSVGLHLLVVFAVWRTFGVRGLLTYLFAYFITLSPVLIISKYETQYLYGGGLALAAAVALVCGRSPLRIAFVVCICALLAVHGYRIQTTAYETGACQTRALDSLSALLPSLSVAADPIVYGPDDTPWWVLARLVNGRVFDADGKKVGLIFSHQPDRAALRFLPNCSVVANES